MTQFVSKLGANAVRMPINEATVSSYWATYTGAIDAVLSKGIVVLCYWDSAKTNKPPDMNAFWNMWKTVTDKYGGNANAYFEIFNEPNMYSTTDLISLYSSWLTQFPTVPQSRVILDGTGDAQNVPNIGSASALASCLLAVHDYSFFGSDTMTSASQWVSQFKGEVGNYSDRTVCTEWGGPMSPGSKNGVSYGSLDYSKSPTNYFEAYIQGMSSQLRAWNMGSFYWAGLKDGDWYSMTTKSGTGSATTLSVSNQSGLDRMQNAWGSAGGAGGAGGGATGGAGRRRVSEGRFQRRLGKRRAGWPRWRDGGDRRRRDRRRGDRKRRRGRRPGRSRWFHGDHWRRERRGRRTRRHVGRERRRDRLHGWQPGKLGRHRRRGPGKRRSGPSRVRDGRKFSAGRHQRRRHRRLLVHHG